MNAQQLHDLIQNHVAALLAWNNDDDAGVVAALNDKTIEVVDTTEYSLQMIGEGCAASLGSEEQGLVARRLFGDTLAAAIAAQVPGWGELQVAQIALGNGKLTLNGADRQATIDSLATEWPAEIRDAIKSLGVRTVSPVENTFGRGSVVTTEDVIAARAWKDLLERLETNRTAAVIGIHDGSLTTWPDVVGVLTT